MRLAFGDGEVVIEAQAEGRARAVESVPAEFTGDERAISFNPHYLLDGLTAAAAPASVRQAPAPGTSRPAAPGTAGPASAPDSAPPGEAPPGGAQPDGGGHVASAHGGRIRLEFTSAAKPALITWVSEENPVAGSDGGTSQDDGTGTSSMRTGSTDAGSTDAGRPEFRYLVVPLRVPVRT